MSTESIVKRAVADHIVVQGRENALLELLTETGAYAVPVVESEPVAADPTPSAPSLSEVPITGTTLDSAEPSETEPSEPDHTPAEPTTLTDTPPDSLDQAQYTTEPEPLPAENEAPHESA